MLKYIAPFMLLVLIAGCTSQEAVQKQEAEDSAFTRAFAAALENRETLGGFRNSRVQTPPSALPAGVEMKTVSYEGETRQLSLILFVPQQTGERSALLFLSEGFYVLDSRISAYPFAARLAAEANCVVALPEYRLSPENEYPAALDDILAAYNFLVTNAEDFAVSPEKICIGGEGTGGELALSAIAREFENTEEVPAGLLLFNPLVPLRLPQSESARLFGKGYALDTTLLNTAIKAYGGPSREIDCSYLPPTLLITAENDILRDQGEALTGKLKTAGKEVKSLRFKGAGHGFLTEERYRNRAIKEAASFFSTVVGAREGASPFP